jgi:hypothetical protein
MYNDGHVIYTKMFGQSRQREKARLRLQDDIKMDLKETGYMVCSEFTWLRIGFKMCFYEHSDETFFLPSPRRYSSG